VLPFSELSSSSDEDLGGSESECSSFSAFAKDELSPPFCLPLDFLKGVLAFGFFLFLSSYDSICVRVLIELEPAHRKYRILELYNRSIQVLNTTTIVSGYTGRDPKEGTSDGSFW